MAGSVLQISPLFIQAVSVMLLRLCRVLHGACDGTAVSPAAGGDFLASVPDQFIQHLLLTDTSITVIRAPLSRLGLIINRASSSF